MVQNNQAEILKMAQSGNLETKVFVATDASLAANGNNTLNVEMNPQHHAVITHLHGIDAAVNSYDLLCNLITHDGVRLLSQDAPFRNMFPPQSSPPRIMEPAIIIPANTRLQLYLSNQTGVAIANTWAYFSGYLIRADQKING